MGRGNQLFLLRLTHLHTFAHKTCCEVTNPSYVHDKWGIYPITLVTETPKPKGVLIKWKAFSRAINDTTRRSWARLPKEHSCGAISGQHKEWCPQLNRRELHSVGAFRPSRAATLLNGGANHSPSLLSLHLLHRNHTAQLAGSFHA